MDGREEGRKAGRRAGGQAGRQAGRFEQGVSIRTAFPSSALHGRLKTSSRPGGDIAYAIREKHPLFSFLLLYSAHRRSMLASYNLVYLGLLSY